MHLLEPGVHPIHTPYTLPAIKKINLINDNTLHTHSRKLTELEKKNDRNHPANFYPKNDGHTSSRF